VRIYLVGGSPHKSLPIAFGRRAILWSASSQSSGQPRGHKSAPRTPSPAWLISPQIPNMLLLGLPWNCFFIEKNYIAFIVDELSGVKMMIFLKKLNARLINHHNFLEIDFENIVL
jgi:hypothetical protein